MKDFYRRSVVLSFKLSKVFHIIEDSSHIIYAIRRTDFILYGVLFILSIKPYFVSEFFGVTHVSFLGNTIVLNIL
jgi:hypothetical protein